MFVGVEDNLGPGRRAGLSEWQANCPDLYRWPQYQDEYLRFAHGRRFSRRIIAGVPSASQQGAMFDRLRRYAVSIIIEQ